MERSNDAGANAYIPSKGERIEFAKRSPVSARAEQSSTPTSYKSSSSSITAVRRACESAGRRIASSSSAALTAPLD